MTVVKKQADRDFREVLDQHPIGGAFRLVYAPQELLAGSATAVPARSTS